MHPIDATIAANVRRIRLERGLTGDELAAKMRTYGFPHWTRPTLSKVESVERPVKASEMVGLCIALDVTIASLVSEEPITENAYVAPDEIAVADPGLDQADMAAAVREVIGVLGPNMKGELIARARATKDLELNLRTSRRLGLTPLQGAALALHLWGADITAERDRRAGTTDRGARGHVTRALQREMLAALHRPALPAAAP